MIATVSASDCTSNLAVFRWSHYVLVLFRGIYHCHVTLRGNSIHWGTVIQNTFLFEFYTGTFHVCDRQISVKLPLTSMKTKKANFFHCHRNFPIAWWAKLSQFSRLVVASCDNIFLNIFYLTLTDALKSFSGPSATILLVIGVKLLRCTYLFDDLYCLMERDTSWRTTKYLYGQNTQKNRDFCRLSKSFVVGKCDWFTKPFVHTLRWNFSRRFDSYWFVTGN